MKNRGLKSENNYLSIYSLFYSSFVSQIVYYYQASSEELAKNLTRWMKW
jgi:hypothetical protein